MIIKHWEGRYFNTNFCERFQFDQYPDKWVFGHNGNDMFQIGKNTLSREEFCLMLADIEDAMAAGANFIDVSNYPTYSKPKEVLEYAAKLSNS